MSNWVSRSAFDALQEEAEVLAAELAEARGTIEDLRAELAILSTPFRIEGPPAYFQRLTIDEREGDAR